MVLQTIDAGSDFKQAPKHVALLCVGLCPKTVDVKFELWIKLGNRLKICFQP